MDSDEFWDFTFDEMALYDLPAQISYALEKSGRQNLTYVGHSQVCLNTKNWPHDFQGTVQAFAGFSINQTIASKVNLFVALAPVAYVDHSKGLLAILADLDIDLLFQFLGIREFLPDATLLQKFAPALCEELDWACADALFWISGPSNHLNTSRISVCTPVLNQT